MTRPELAPFAGLGLTRIQFFGILSLVFALFLVVAGPIWDRVWNPDANILWSYAPIPSLVLACQVWNRSFGLGRWILGSFVLAAVKYLMTAALFVVLLSWAGRPPEHASARGASPVVKLDTPMSSPSAPHVSVTTPIGTLRGRVQFSEGNPAAGVFVYFVNGLSEWSFPQSHRAWTLQMDDGRIEPRALCIGAGDTLRVKSLDGSLHTLQAFAKKDQYLFNAPIVGEREVSLEGIRGKIQLRCAVHAGETGEIVVLTHPFHSLTNSTGKFEIPGIPAGDKTLAVWAPGSVPVSVKLKTTSPGPQLVTLTARGGSLEIRQD